MRKQTIMSIKNSGIAVSESGRSRFTPIHLAVAIVVGLLCLTPHFTYGDGRHQFLAITFVVLLGVFCGSGGGQQRAVPVAIVAAGYALIWAATNIVAAQLRTDLVATPAIWLRTSAGALVVFPLCALFGLGLGILFRNRSAAVIGMLLYLTHLEPLFCRGLNGIGWSSAITYLPAMSAAKALDGLTAAHRVLGGFAVVQPAWLTLLVFIGWTALALLAGTAVTRSQKGDRR
ncbi:MAG TPA: hypothetical protein VK735_02245 [Pseudonocardia sp.]|jgi:hypothetical protein|uniref:hypothetical protein n=1 Tax=Pseudonocardia sp. TaxID=60912 RepID=UPI002BD869D2|nr:hypothetical protein [Pseudonocardia sp.]HTF46248.1 hypothetical protein [Pseudonocardia sp.]